MQDKAYPQLPTAFQCKLAPGLILFLFLSVTLFIKLAVPLGGGDQLFFGLVVIYGVCGLGLLTSTLAFEPKQLGITLLLLGSLVGIQLIGGTNFSIFSVIFLFIVLLPYTLRPRNGTLRPGIELVYFQNLMVIFAVLGIIQFFLQFVIGSDWAFLIDTKLPASIVKQQFNSLNPLGYGSTTYKSTAFFMQEASNFSQFLSIAILVELIYFMNWKRMALYFSALALTFSGTGLIILALLAPFYLIATRRIGLLVTGILFVTTLPLWGEFVGLGYTVGRLSEFNSTQTSAFARFISPYVSIQNKLIPEGPWATLFGLGAGSMLRTIGSGVDYQVATSTWSKIIYEYGFIGGILFYAYMGYLMFSGRKNVFLIFAVFINFYFLGEYILAPTVHALIMAFLVWPSTTRDDKIYVTNTLLARLQPAPEPELQPEPEPNSSPAVKI